MTLADVRLHEARLAYTAAERRYLAARDAGQRDIDAELLELTTARLAYARAVRAEFEARKEQR